MAAKQRTITAPSGSDDNLKSLGDQTPVRSTIASIVRAALSLATAAKAVIINMGFAGGKVKAVIVPTGAAAPTGTGVTKVGEFSLIDPTVSKTAWQWETVEGGDSLSGALSGILDSKVPSYSVESLTNAIEDTTINAELGGYKFIVNYDQADGLIKVYKASEENAAAYDPATQYAEEVAFLGTQDTTLGAQFGE